MKKIMFCAAFVLLMGVLASCRQAAPAPEAAVDTTSAVETPVECSFDLNAMAADTLQHFKDGDGYVLMKMVKAGDNKIMLATLPQGSSVGFHTHESDMEVIYVQQGTATIVLDSTELTYTAGHVHYCPKGHGHSISNRAGEDLVIYNIVATQG